MGLCAKIVELTDKHSDRFAMWWHICSELSRVVSVDHSIALSIKTYGAMHDMSGGRDNVSGSMVSFTRRRSVAVFEMKRSGATVSLTVDLDSAVRTYDIVITCRGSRIRVNEIAAAAAYIESLNQQQAE